MHSHFRPFLLLPLGLVLLFDGYSPFDTNQPGKFAWPFGRMGPLRAL